MKVTSLCVWVKGLTESCQANQRQHYCLNGGESFTATGGNHRYCSACGEERRRQRNREKGKRDYERHREELREKYRKRSGKPRLRTGYLGLDDQGKRSFERTCRKCGKPYITTGVKARYCLKCQQVRYRDRKLRRMRIYNTRVRNTQKLCKAGTFDNKEYLQILDNGRIFGALLLQKGISINARGRYTKQGSMERSAYLGIDKRILRIDGNIYCDECGAEILLVRTNHTNYTIPIELCCKSCGLVYELDDLAQLT